MSLDKQMSELVMKRDNANEFRNAVNDKGQCNASKINCRSRSRSRTRSPSTLALASRIKESVMKWWSKCISMVVAKTAMERRRSNGSVRKEEICCESFF